MTDTMTNGQKEDVLEGALEVLLAGDDQGGYYYAYVLDFTDTWVVYSSYEGTYQISYTMDDDGTVAFTGDPEPVYSVTTYEPVKESKNAGPLERRGGPNMRLRARMVESSQGATVKVRSEPLTYSRWGRDSFYRDLILRDRVDGAAGRLRRHAREMDVISKEQNARSLRSLRSGEIEYRVEPNRTDGEGGYLAPPAWLNQLFATAPRPDRILASLIPGTFALPQGCSSVNLPIIQTGTAVQPVADLQADPSQDITDAPGSSTVVTLSGHADVSVQSLEQSPTGAHLDFAIFADLSSAYDAQLETQLLVGGGIAMNQILGVANVGTPVAYTDGSPSGSEMYPIFGQTVAQLANGRNRPPEAWMARTARWAWFTTQEDTAGLPFGLPSPFYMGSDSETPDPLGGLLGFPLFGNEALPANLGAGGNQDEMICLRPSDLLLFEAQPTTAVMRDPGSGALSVRLQLHNRAAAITNRYPSGICVAGGTGFVVQSNF
jgi:HK97 family phage major capsid protein